MGFGYCSYPSYNGYSDVSGKGTDKMIDQLIAKHDELPALPTEKRLLFLHCGTGGAPESTIDRKYSRLRTAFREVTAAHLFKMEAVVILPDHLHCIWTLHEGDDDFSIHCNRSKRLSRVNCPGPPIDTIKVNVGTL